MKYKYLIFDLDDTLIDNIENVRWAFKRMLEYLKLEYSDEYFNEWYFFDKQFWDDYANGLIEVPDEYKYSRDMYVSYVQSQRYVRFFGNMSVDESLRVNELFLNSLKEVVIAVEGAKEVLEELARKYEIVVATNGPRQSVFAKIAKIDCESYVKYVFSADMTDNKVTKPNKLYFQELMEYIKCSDKGKLLIIGDSLKTDVKGGMNAAIDSCWFNRKHEELSEGYQPTYVIQELKELKKILK